jgi:hypothetical protein
MFARELIECDGPPGPKESALIQDIEGRLSRICGQKLTDDAVVAASSTREINDRDVQRAVAKTLNGLVGLDKFEKLFALDLNDFFRSKSGRIRIFWGDSSTGKTEVAQRLAGLREGIPGLSIGCPRVMYLSGVDGKIEIRDLVDQAPEGTLLLIDEADKCLLPAAGMVTQAEATQLQHAILTYCSRKPIYWALIGTFSSIRGESRITHSMLDEAFGRELASRIDFDDWEFPRWTLENLLRAAETCGRRNLVYEDNALLVLCQYCLDTGGGVRALDALEQAIYRKFQSQPNLTNKVTEADVRDLLKRRGYKKA